MSNGGRVETASGALFQGDSGNEILHATFTFLLALCVRKESRGLSGPEHIFVRVVDSAIIPAAEWMRNFVTELVTTDTGFAFGNTLAVCDPSSWQGTEPR